MKLIESISVSKAAIIKNVSRQTIYNNKEKFDWTSDNRIIPNDKFIKWERDSRGGK